jgi:DNA-binding beta-propeller fold protein YncE
MRRTLTLSYVVLSMVLALALVASPSPAAGATLPAPLGDYQFTVLATDSSGGLYACDGNTVYRRSGSTFTTLATGIASVADVIVDPSGFAVNAAGTKAYVATGNSGRLVEVDLVAHSARELSGARGSWAYGNYGLAVDPIYGNIFVTDSLNQDLYRLDPAGSGSLSFVKHFTGGACGGGLAFSPTGELYVPVATGFGAWPTSDVFPLDMYRFSRSWLDALAAGQTILPDPTRYATGLAVSGTGFAAADADGVVYVEAADAIYRVGADGTISTFLGDPSKNVFDYSMTSAGFMGLTYDLATDQVFYGYRDTKSDPLGLGAAPAPEPATLALLGLGAAALAARRRKANR